MIWQKELALQWESYGNYNTSDVICWCHLPMKMIQDWQNRLIHTWSPNIMRMRRTCLNASDWQMKWWWWIRSKWIFLPPFVCPQPVFLRINVKQRQRNPALGEMWKGVVTKLCVALVILVVGGDESSWEEFGFAGRCPSNVNVIPTTRWQFSFTNASYHPTLQRQNFSTGQQVTICTVQFLEIFMSVH